MIDQEIIDDAPECPICLIPIETGKGFGIVQSDILDTNQVL